MKTRTLNLLSRTGARLGNWNDRRHGPSLGRRPSPLRWRRIDRIAGRLYVLGDRAIVPAADTATQGKRPPALSKEERLRRRDPFLVPAESSGEYPPACGAKHPHSDVSCVLPAGHDGHHRIGQVAWPVVSAADTTTESDLENRLRAEADRMESEYGHLTYDGVAVAEFMRALLDVPAADTATQSDPRFGAANAHALAADVLFGQRASREDETDG